MAFRGVEVIRALFACESKKVLTTIIKVCYNFYVCGRNRNRKITV